MAVNQATLPIGANPAGGPPTAPSAGQVITGGRAYITLNDGAPVGIFDSVTYNVTMGNEPIHILGNYAVQEIAITSQEAISLTCTGFRIVGNGPYGAGQVPTVGQLLALEGMTITITDRQTGQILLTVGNCKAVGFNGNHNARATSKLTINYLGTQVGDESTNSAAVSDTAGSTSTSLP